MSSATTPGTPLDGPWPRYLWLAQLLVPLPVIGYAARRFLIGDPPGPVLLPAALLALLWTVAAITVLSLPRGRRWIGARRLEILTCFIALGSTVALFDLALTVTGTVPTIGAIMPAPSAGLDHQRLVEAFAATDLIVEEAARDLGARVVDLNGPLNGRSELFRDHVHFTAAGSRTAADYAARDLEAMLAGLLTDPDETP